MRAGRMAPALGGIDHIELIEDDHGQCRIRIRP
jgi:hypothetical protein